MLHFPNPDLPLLYCAVPLSPSYLYSTEIWLPAKKKKKKVGASQARGKRRETEAGRGAGCGNEECFSHILTVTLANSLPLLILSVSSAFRVIADVIPPTSISNPTIFSVSCHSWKCTFKSQPRERHFERLIKRNKLKVGICQKKRGGGQWTASHLWSHFSVKPIPCPSPTPSLISSGSSCECNR